MGVGVVGRRGEEVGQAAAGGLDGRGSPWSGALATAAGPSGSCGCQQEPGRSDGEGRCKIGYRWAPGVH